MGRHCHKRHRLSGMCQRVVGTSIAHLVFSTAFSAGTSWSDWIQLSSSTTLAAASAPPVKSHLAQSVEQQLLGLPSLAFCLHSVRLAM